MIGAEGIFDGAEKCIEIGKNTKGEGAQLGLTLTLRDDQGGILLYELYAQEGIEESYLSYINKIIIDIKTSLSNH